MTIWITEGVRSAIEREAALLHPLETGGMLLGWRTGPDRIVAGIVGAGPHAMHGRHAFVPDHRWQMEWSRRAFAETDGDLDYLGDWHTHPDGPAAISRTDEATLRRIARHVRHPSTLIAAGGPARWTLKAWTWSGGGIVRRGRPSPQDVLTTTPPPGWPDWSVDRHPRRSADGDRRRHSATAGDRRTVR